METKDLWGFINFGTGLRYLQDVQQYSVHGDSFVLENINRFMKAIEVLNLHVTKRASQELEEIQKQLAKKPKNARLTSVEAERIRNIIKDIRKTLCAETKGNFVYMISDKRMDVNKLMNSVDKLFAPNILNKCPEIARYDFQEAGKCISFERPTAAAFHLMRGTEAVLRLYHKNFIRSNINNRNWGTIINELRSKNRGKIPDETLINNLDNLRHSFRNPTQHPDKIYDIDEVQDLFGICIDVVNRMISAIKK